jgi:hypothetical protein
VPGPAGGEEITRLRVLLAADLLFRSAELENLQVLTALTSDGGSGEGLDALTRSASTGRRPVSAPGRPRQRWVARSTST